MRLFLDSSVLLAACGSDRGASREVFRLAGESDWTLLTSLYVGGEVSVNLAKLPAPATVDWRRLHAQLALVDDVLTLDRAVVFEPAKDRPILFTALAWSEVLLTLDQNHFGKLLGDDFYGLPLLTPGAFLQRERAAGRLREG